MRIFVDCTETYKTKLNTGIQRVVLQIVTNSPSINGIEIIPVIYDGNGLLEISSDDLLPQNFQITHKIQSKLKRFPIYNSCKAIFNLLVSISIKLKSNKKYVHLKKDDKILLADLIRNREFIHFLQDCNKKNIRIYQVVYDLLPIMLPQFFNYQDVINYKTLSSQWLTYSPYFLAISKKVQNDITSTFKTKNVDFFYLGADFVHPRTDKKPTVIPIDFKSYFLVVGTIEPRKNHLTILKVFHQLWNNGFSKKLIFVGRIGWGSSEILEQIKFTQKKYLDQFIWLENVDDRALEVYYEKSEAIICASIDEGFGLPIVEALSRKKNVICSDIKVFREIGATHCSYFDLNDNKSLYEIIMSKDYIKDIDNFKSLTWKESVNQLIGKILKNEKYE